MLIPLTNNSIIILNQFFSIFVIISVASILLEQALSVLVSSKDV